MIRHVIVLAAFSTVLTSCAPIRIAEPTWTMGSGKAADNGENKAAAGPLSSSVLQDLKNNDSARSLASWWSFFDDPVLENLVNSALSLNGNTYKSDDKTIQTPWSEEALRSYFHKPELRLVVEVAQTYLDYRYVQNQKMLLQQYIEQLNMIEDKGPRFEAKMDQHFRLKEQFVLQEKNALTKLARLAKLLPEYVAQILKEHKKLPATNIMPILASPSDLMLGAQDIQVASSLLMQQTQGQFSVASAHEVFSSRMIGHFYGVSDAAFIDENASWRVFLGQGAQELNFSKQGGVQEHDQAYKEFKKRALEYVMNVEHAFVSYANMHEQYLVLEEAQSQATTSDGVYKTRLAALRAQFEKARMLVDLYKMLGVY